MKDKEKELTAVIETVLRETKNCDMSIETLTDYLVDRIKNKVIIEDSVVLSREEYERLKLELAIEKKRADGSYTQKEVEEIIASKERIKSKETARKILEKIDKESNGQTISITNLLRKQFGVKIKE